MQQSKRGKTTIEIVREIAEPIAKDLGLSLWDVRFQKEGTQWYLRIFIDKEGGVSIDDCEAMSRAIDKPLDDLDPISQSYCLEVCSPGVERELITDYHFNKFIGSDVKLKLIRPDEFGEREFVGELLGIENDDIILEIDKESRNFKHSDVAYVRLVDSTLNNF